MKQVLSVVQMKYLQELGVNTSDASMVFATDDDGCMLLWEDAEKAIKNHLYDVYFNLYYVESSSYDHSCKKECGVFTLQDILDKLPCFIGKEVLTIQKLADSYTCLYMEYYTRSMINIQRVKNSLMQPMKCCAGASKTDMLKLGRRNNYGIYNTVLYTQKHTGASEEAGRIGI